MSLEALADSGLAQSPAKEAVRAARRLKLYFSLGKPGIALSVLITTFSGFMAANFSQKQTPDLTTLAHTLIGTFLVSMGAGTLNMLLELDSDKLMNRTRNRPLPSGIIAPHKAFFLGGFSASVGLAHLAAATNLQSCFFAAIGLALYLVFYTPMKKTSAFNTVVGAVGGAVPPLIGWCAAGAALSAQAWSLFALLFLWQIPHFMVLFWLYRTDYESAGIKTLLADPSGARTARWSFGLSLLIAAASFVPYSLGLGGWGYAAAAALLNGLLLAGSWRFLGHPSPRTARVFFFSTVFYLPLVFLALAAGL